MSVQAVPRAGRLADEVLARLEEEPQLGRAIREPDRRQVRLPSGDSRDRERIARIALAWPTRPPALDPAQVRRHLADGETRQLGGSGQRRPER